MTLTIPDDEPRFRFMRYVRPHRGSAGKDKGALFPIRPGLRKIRIAVDVDTLSLQSEELMRVLAREEEVEVFLLVQNSASEPREWMSELGLPQWYKFNFTTVDESPKMGDTSEVEISGYENGEIVLSTRGSFFDVYSQLDHRVYDSLEGSGGISLTDRHRAAALACAAEAIAADVTVTNSPTAGRSDVSDNDIILSLTPSQLWPLFGHYLRVTGNQVLDYSRGSLSSGAHYVRKTRSSSIADLYVNGINSSMPHLRSIGLMAVAGKDQTLASSMEAITTRLARAARAVDDVLAALSNKGSSDLQEQDVTEMTAEAFERMLLYLCAAMDRYARTTQWLFDQSIDLESLRRGSLTSPTELSKIIGYFPTSDAKELEELGAYAEVIGKLRNRIHALPLNAGRQLSRSYGSSTTVAVTLEGLAELDPNRTPLAQDQIDRLGVWNAWSDNDPSSRVYVADMATLATTLFRETLRYLEEFSIFLIRNEPSGEKEPHPLIGCFAKGADAQLEEFPRERFARQMFGWSDFG